MDPADQRQPGLLRAVRARPGRQPAAQRRRARPDVAATSSGVPTRSCSTTTARATCSGRSASSRASWRPPPSCASRTASPATSRSWPAPTTGSTTPAGCCPAATRRPPTCTAPGSGWSRRPASCCANGLGLLGVTAPERMVGAVRAPPCRSHGDVGLAHGRPRTPGHHLTLLPQPWPCRRWRRNAPSGSPDLRRPRRAQPGRPARDARRSCWTRPTSGRAAATTARRFGGAMVFYAAKAFLCTGDRPLGRRGRAWVDVHRRRAGRGARGRHAPRADRLHGNNKSPAELSGGARRGDRPDRRRLARRDRTARRAGERRGRAGPVLVRATVGVEAHTHEYIATAHEDQKFGFSLAGGAARAAVDRVLGDDVLDLVGLHSHIGSQIFDTAGFEVAAHRVIGTSGAIRDGLGDRAARARPRRRLRHRVHDADDPADVVEIRARGSLARIVERESTSCEDCPSAVGDRAGPRHRRARARSRSTRWAPSSRSRGCDLRVRGRGHEWLQDPHRPMYGADYTRGGGVAGLGCRPPCSRESWARH